MAETDQIQRSAATNAFYRQLPSLYEKQRAARDEQQQKSGLCGAIVSDLPFAC